MMRSPLRREGLGLFRGREEVGVQDPEKRKEEKGGTVPLGKK